MFANLKFAFRQLTKSPGFTVVAVLTLAIGIAATTSLFTVVNALLFDPLPYPNSQQLVQVWTKDREQLFSYSPLSNGTFFDLKDRASSFAAIGAFSVTRFNLVIRMAPGTLAPIEAIRDELRRLDPDLAMTQFRTMTSHFDEQSRVFTTITSLVDIMTTAILGLAALSLYGTLSFHFTRRRREIGVRVALGASSRDIVALVFRQAFVWVAAGLTLGVVGAWLLGRAVSHMLEGANPSSITSLSLSILLVFLAAILGAWLPVRRATRVNPIEALRAE